jgi:hypothetical protein
MPKKTALKSNLSLDSTYPFISPEKRLKILKETKGMWKDRTPDPIKELKKIRKEWERKLPLSSK